MTRSTRSGKNYSSGWASQLKRPPMPRFDGFLHFLIQPSLLIVAAVAAAAAAATPPSTRNPLPAPGLWVQRSVGLAAHFILEALVVLIRAPSP